VATPDGLTVYAYPQTASGESCAEPPFQLSTFTTSTGGIVARSKPGTYVEAGLPFGAYAFCFQRNVSTGSPTGNAWTVYPTDWSSSTPYDLRSTARGPALTTLDGSASAKWHTSGGSGTGGRFCPTNVVLP
jgi:hypothetical protein